MRDFHLPGRSSVIATNGMCATSHPIAARVAVNMLTSGGNAVDSAIAAALVLGICEPQMTGIGGDCFFLVKKPGSEEIVGLNGSGRAPAALDPEKLRASGHKEMPVYDANAVSIPGAIDAMLAMASDYGSKEIAEILAPAIHYADHGIPVAPRVAFDWAETAPELKGDAGKYFLSTGKSPNTGDIFRAPGQAQVLRKIAKEGRAGFYEGEVAEDMVASLNTHGGCHTLDDFAATKCDYVEPISGGYRDIELVELPPNGQGATAILMANILSNFDIASMEPEGALRAHIEAEAAKLAYDARNRFVAENSPRLDHMLSQQTADELAALIDPGSVIASATEVTEAVHKETIYITVVDKDRMAVSLIYSIFHSFGSRIASSKFGVLFQNRAAGFTLEPGHPNEAGGGKRPMHTIIPAMIRKSGKVIMPFGVMGGQYQSAGHARFISNVADFGMDPQETMDAPRSFPQDGFLDVERGYSDNVRQELAEIGHNVRVPETAIGGSQAIRIDEDVLVGGSDPRKDGCALGY